MSLTTPSAPHKWSHEPFCGWRVGTKILEISKRDAALPWVSAQKSTLLAKWNSHPELELQSSTKNFGNFHSLPPGLPENVSLIRTIATRQRGPMIQFLEAFSAVLWKEICHQTFWAPNDLNGGARSLTRDPPSQERKHGSMNPQPIFHYILYIFPLLGDAKWSDSSVACWAQLWIQVTQKRQALQWHIATTKRSTFISLGGVPRCQDGFWLGRLDLHVRDLFGHFNINFPWKTWNTNFLKLTNGLHSEVLKSSRFCGPRHGRVAWCSEWWQWNQYVLRSSPTPLSTLTCVASCTSQGCCPAGWFTYERPCPRVNLVYIIMYIYINILEDLAGLQMNGRFPLISHTRYLSHTSLNCPSNSCPTPSSYGLKPFELTQDVTSTVASSMCKFPACFCPHPPPTKKKSSSNAWCAKLWASSRACHTIHEEEVVKSEHSPGQHSLYSKQECQQTLSGDSRFSFLQKEHVIFLHSIISTFTF